MIPIKKLANLFCLVLLVTAHASSLLAQNTPSLPTEPREQDFVIKNFKFRNGETLPELKVHYMTFGTPHKSASGTIHTPFFSFTGRRKQAKNSLRQALPRSFMAKASLSTSRNSLSLCRTA